MTGDEAGLAVLILLIAALYSSVGHAGASGYLAAMAFVGLAPEAMRPTALTLNILVASIATFRYARAGQFDWRIFYPLVLTSVPFAFLGGALQLTSRTYKATVGAILLIGALELFRSARKPPKSRGRTPLVPILLLVGAVIGLFSGLTGMGGGIFLSPVLLFVGWAMPRATSGIAAAFILCNSIAALAGTTTFSSATLPADLPLWLAAAALGGLIGTQLGSRVLPVFAVRYALATVLLVAGGKLILI